MLSQLPHLPRSYAPLIRRVALQFAMGVDDVHLEALHRLDMEGLSLNACHRQAWLVRSVSTKQQLSHALRVRGPQRVNRLLVKICLPRLRGSQN